MAISQKQSKRKPTGGRYTNIHSKKQNELGSKPTLTKLEPRRARSLRTIGGNDKQRLLSAETINVYDPKTKKHKSAKIKSVEDNSANRNYIRRNFLTKGAIVDTEAGKAKITSRPGQEGTVNGVLV